MSRVKMIHNENKTEIEVPFAHAMEVLLPQGRYSLLDKVLSKALDEPIDQDGEVTFKEEDINITRGAMADILNRGNIQFPGNARKADLLELIKLNKLMGVNITGE